MIQCFVPWDGSPGNGRNNGSASTTEQLKASEKEIWAYNWASKTNSWVEHCIKVDSVHCITKQKKIWITWTSWSKEVKNNWIMNIDLQILNLWYLASQIESFLLNSVDRWKIRVSDWKQEWSQSNKMTCLDEGMHGQWRSTKCLFECSCVCLFE